MFGLKRSKVREVPLGKKVRPKSKRAKKHQALKAAGRTAATQSK
jgi:hypothetical protein